MQLVLTLHSYSKLEWGGGGGAEKVRKCGWVGGGEALSPPLPGSLCLPVGGKWVAFGRSPCASVPAAGSPTDWAAKTSALANDFLSLASRRH